jgi:hypothetical protein
MGGGVLAIPTPARASSRPEGRRDDDEWKPSVVNGAE